ncbi:MAG: nucleotidyl transferase AbiEii/AbiGii toxin family protein [Bacilli bacterium]|nr:nucleotidyl transferase AbiEii/AbiGii toxin family protein [Bacilli bacterium]
MNDAIETMLKKYRIENKKDKENAIKEIIQEIVLSGLSRGGFFDKAVFYGGTCLRIFHHLDRFSEDLDFALLERDDSFNIEEYFPSVKKELAAYGLEMEVNRKHKTSEEKEIQSAFVKGNTQMLVLTFFPNDKVNDIVSNQSVKVKFEIDTDNPSGGIVESKYSLLPSPYEVKVFDKTTLFAGKVHAIICRDYKNRVKGRDYYDYLFYCARDVKLNLKYLENKLKNSKKIDNSVVLDITLVKKMLKDKFESLDYEAAKKDVSNFVKDQSSLDIWGKDLFLSTLDKLC